MTTIGDRIKQRRKELGLSVDDIAEKLDKNRATIYRYESDYIENLPITIINPLADVLKTTPAYLMGWNDIAETINKDDINTIVNGFKENKEFINRISSYNEESLKNFIEYLHATFSEEITSLDDKFTALDVFKLYEYVNKIVSFELNKLTSENKNEIKNLNGIDLTTASKEESQSLEDKYTTLAAHDDDLTNNEKQNVDMKIMEALKKRQK